MVKPVKNIHVEELKPIRDGDNYYLNIHVPPMSVQSSWVKSYTARYGPAAATGAGRHVLVVSSHIFPDPSVVINDIVENCPETTEEPAPSVTDLIQDNLEALKVKNGIVYEVVYGYGDTMSFTRQDYADFYARENDGGVIRRIRGQNDVV
jgi:hypothetical protein